MDWSVCTCMQYGPQELLLRWQRRAMPVVSRLAFHGHGIDGARLDATVALILVVEKGAPECFSDENRSRSHHLPDCPWRRRGPHPSLEEKAATRERVSGYMAEAFAEYTAGPYADAVNRRFTGNAPGSPVTAG